MSRPTDPATWRESLGHRPFSVGFRAISRAMRGLPLTDDEHGAFVEMTGGIEPTAGGFEDMLLIKPRRVGGSEWLATEGVYECRHGGHEIAMAPGQYGAFPIIAARRDQGEEVLSYAKGLCRHPSMKRAVERITAGEIYFANSTVLPVTTCDINAVSSTTAIGRGLDELAKWPGEGVREDRVVIDTLDAATAPVRGAPPRRRLAITSCFIQDGEAYRQDMAYFGRPDAPVLVFRGSFKLLNPAIDQRYLEKQRAKLDPAVFLREYGDGWARPPEWQAALTEGWFSDLITPCVDAGITIRERRDWARHVIAIDAAFKGDRFAIAVAHAETRDAPLPLLVLDHVVAFEPPKRGALSPEDCLARLAKICDAYGNRTVLCDQFGAEPLKALARQYGIHLVEIPWTGVSKPHRFRTVRDAMADRRVRLVDCPELTRELHGIQGELLRSGGERIEARYGRDDMVSAAVLCLSEAARYARAPDTDATERRDAAQFATLSRAVYPHTSTILGGYDAEDDDEPRQFVERQASRRR